MDGRKRKFNKNRRKSSTRDKSSQPSYKKNSGVLQFSDQPTLLDIANQNSGSIGYDISVNGFTTTQGNRTYALITPGLEPVTINIQPGLPVYMGSKANSEVEYPTLDSNNTPDATGKVSTDKLSIGRQDNLASVQANLMFHYQGLTTMIILDDDGTNPIVPTVAGLQATSVTSRIEHNNKISTLIARLQSTVAIEDLEFLQLTASEAKIKYKNSAATHDITPWFASDNIDFQIQSTLLHLYQRDVQAMALDYLKIAQITAQVNHIKHIYPSLSKRIELNYDELKKATNFTAITRLFSTISEEYVDLQTWNVDIKPLGIYSTSKWGVDGYLKEPDIDFSSMLMVDKWADPAKPDVNWTTNVMDGESLSNAVFKYKSGDIDLKYTTYQKQFVNFLDEFLGKELVDFSKYLRKATDEIKAFLATWKDMTRIIKVALQTITATGICNWVRFLSLPEIRSAMIDNFCMLEDMLQITSITLPIEKTIKEGEFNLRTPIFDSLAKPVPLLMRGQSYSKFWPVAKFNYSIKMGKVSDFSGSFEYSMINSDGNVGDLILVGYQTFPFYTILNAGVSYLSEYMATTSYCMISFVNGLVPNAAFNTFKIRKAQQLLRMLPMFTSEIASKQFSFFIDPNIITDSVARAPDFERLSIDYLRTNGIINTYGRAN